MVSNVFVNEESQCARPCWLHLSGNSNLLYITTDPNRCRCWQHPAEAGWEANEHLILNYRPYTLYFWNKITSKMHTRWKPDGRSGVQGHHWLSSKLGCRRLCLQHKQQTQQKHYLPLHKHLTIIDIFSNVHLKIYFMCVSILPTWIYMDHFHARCPWKSEMSVSSPETQPWHRC